MKKSLRVLTILFTINSFVTANVVHKITIDGAINPVVTEFIIQSIERAEDANAELLVIEMDTPGGLMASMHLIVKSILASEVPVAVYVAPSGSRAGSAGVFITMAAHIAAMAPSTNIGSAHPVNLGGGSDTSQVMAEKIINDAVASIRSIAEKRGRNADWAEKAIRESANITETEALEQNVIEYIVPLVDSLLSEIDGKEIEVVNGKKILNTRNARIEQQHMSWRQKGLNVLSDPNIAYLLFLLGMAGIFFEIQNPGAIVPGVLGGISMILALSSMQTLPVNYAGLLLIILAVVMFLLEIKVQSYGILSIGGVVSFVIGSIMLIDSPLPFLQISWQIILGAAITTTAFFIFAVGMAYRAQKRQITTGREGLVGERGKVIENLNPEGSIEVHGEIWNAIADIKIKKGHKVEIVEVDPKHLIVKVKAVL
ncbi:MAG: nodulation protein NfeD [Calditrichia bacterium]|nr:nodulation protein NfeD [Calditrichia bacterium]